MQKLVTWAEPCRPLSGGDEQSILQLIGVNWDRRSYIYICCFIAKILFQISIVTITFHFSLWYSTSTFTCTYFHCAKFLQVAIKSNSCAIDRFSFFSARCRLIYTSCAYATMSVSVCPSLCDGSYGSFGSRCMPGRGRPGSSQQQHLALCYSHC